jgi:hypothetical protein
MVFNRTAALDRYFLKNCSFVKFDAFDPRSIRKELIIFEIYEYFAHFEFLASSVEPVFCLLQIRVSY